MLVIAIVLIILFAVTMMLVSARADRTLAVAAGGVLTLLRWIGGAIAAVTTIYLMLLIGALVRMQTWG